MNNPKGSSKKNINKRTRGDDMLSNIPLSQAQDDVVKDNLPAQASHSVGEISKQAEDKPSSSMRLRSSCHVKEVMAMSEDFVQDQIIIAPEIMSLILEQLDIHSLKQVRLACKSWLQEAQAHMKTRTVVQIYGRGFAARLKSFNETRRNTLPALPSPFESVDVDLCSWTKPQDRGHKCLLSQLRSIRPPIVVTRFSPEQVPLMLTLPLIIQWSSSLEYLKLDITSVEVGYLPPMDPEQKFPKLRHIWMEIRCNYLQNSEAISNHFHSIGTWIVNSSSCLEAFKYTNTIYKYKSRFKSERELLLKINIKDVKSLLFVDYSSSSEALEHLHSIPFSRLENLKIQFRNVSPSIHESVVATVKKSARTLKTLCLYQMKNQLSLMEFPVCPNVHDLHMLDLEHSKLFISNPFPSLQVLNLIMFEEDVLGDAWRELPPFVGLKTLRVKYCRGSNLYKLPMKFFEKFPSLERLEIDRGLLLHCCQLEATGESSCPRMLDGIQHLELFYLLQEGDHDHSLLRFLNGIKTLKVSDVDDVFRIPFREMPSLSVFEFPFPVRAPWKFDKLLEMAQEVEKVMVTNCCNLRSHANQKTKDVLNFFFDSAPNAVCGCRTSAKFF